MSHLAIQSPKQTSEGTDRESRTQISMRQKELFRGALLTNKQGGEQDSEKIYFQPGSENPAHYDFIVL